MRDATMRVLFCGFFASSSSAVTRRGGRTVGWAIMFVVFTAGGGSGFVAPSVGYAGEVLEFSGPGCLACQRMSPMVEKLKRQGYPIRVLDIRRAPRLARQLGVNLLPTFVLIEQGRAVKKIVGVTTEQRLRSLAAAARASSRKSPSKRESESDPGPSPSARLTGLADSSAPVVRANSGSGTEPDSGRGLQSSCVRLRLEQADGHEFASGTIIDSQRGRSIILTCGHLFRNYHPRGKAGSAVGTTGSGGRLIVDVFDGRRSTSYAGRLLGHDLESDVGLVQIVSRKLLPVARIADPVSRLSAGQRLISFGCNGGDRPTRELVAVTRLNRYLGPDNVECTGVPLQGRSGGGLLDAAGRVVGVCFAADPTYQRGLYAGLRPIHDLLARCHLTSLVAHRDQPSPRRDAIPTAARTPVSPPGNRRRSLDDFPPPSVKTAPRPSVAQATRPTTPMVPPRSTSGRSRDVSEVAAVQAALAGASGAEVVCIIRSVDNPRAASRVVIINRASRKFVADLLGEVDVQARPTSGFEARRPRPTTGLTHRAATDATPRMSLPVIRGGGYSIRPGPVR